MCLLIRMRVYNTARPAPHTVNKAGNGLGRRIRENVFPNADGWFFDGFIISLFLLLLLLLLFKRYAPRACNICADRRELGQK